MFTITEEAEAYIADLFADQDEKNLALKVDVEKAGTHLATVTFNFCTPDDLPNTYKKFEYKGFNCYVDESNFVYLEESSVSLKTQDASKKLTILAPKSKGEAPKDDAPLSERIKYTLAVEISPQLASHGGFVELVEVTKNVDVVLNFGGGCQGCSSVKMTLKNGIERQLKVLFPEIKNVIDATDHSYVKNAYM
jgi:Fe/S biogenesis protein NfuA